MNAQMPPSTPGYQPGQQPGQQPAGQAPYPPQYAAPAQAQHPAHPSPQGQAPQPHPQGQHPQGQYAPGQYGQGQPQQGQPQAQYPQGQMQAPQPQAQPAGPMGTIRFTVQGGFMTASMIRPDVKMNGYPVAITNYGTTDVPVPAGTVNVEAHMTYIWGPYGRAGLQVQVPPGQVVPVHYAQPYMSFGQGRMGLEPQERQGKGAYIAILCTAIAIPVALVGILIGTAMFL